MYTNQTLHVKWGGHDAPSFNVINGTKQGGILSPTLFAVYMDGLFDRLNSLNVGCRVGTHFAGALGYADDLNLLCPTLYGLRRMINVCEDYAREYDIIFNGTKSKLLVFKGDDCFLKVPPVNMCAGQCFRRDVSVNNQYVE